MFKKMIKKSAKIATLRLGLKETSRGVHNHYFHAGVASK